MTERCKEHDRVAEGHFYTYIGSETNFRWRGNPEKNPEDWQAHPKCFLCNLDMYEVIYADIIDDGPDCELAEHFDVPMEFWLMWNYGWRPEHTCTGVDCWSNK